MTNCDFTTGVCPDCDATAAPGTLRNCPKKMPRVRLPRQHNELVGNALIDLFQILRIKKRPGCNCDAIAASMNMLGVAGCREHRDELLAALNENYDLYGLGDKMVAAASSITSGLFWRINLFDPLGSLLDEAIRRAG